MKKPLKMRVHEAWAHLRYTVISRLLMRPSERGELQDRLRSLASEEWTHPVTGCPVRFGLSTIERWYYQALTHRNPVEVLRRKIRRDAGRCRSMSDALKKALVKLHELHRYWSYKLHWENLQALVEEKRKLGRVPSYPTVRRYMIQNDLRKLRKPRHADRPGCDHSRRKKAGREMRGFEVEHALALVHLDFHAGSRRVVLPDGSLVTPQLFACIDDHSRVILHVQWYLDETAETLVHGVCQGFQKRGLPRTLLHDNGSAMKAAEFLEGLQRLSIGVENTLSYCPEQNGKQETWWKHIEQRLLPMLETVAVVTLAELNEATLAYTEMGYHHSLHEELGMTPMERYQQAMSVGRPCPALDELRQRFTQAESRQVRRGDGTVSVEGKRFEIPSAYRHLQTATIRYARWDLTQVLLADSRTGNVLCRLHPQDKAKNADGRRRVHVPVAAPDRPDLETFPPRPLLTRARDEVAPLLRKYLREYAATGFPPAYIPPRGQQDTKGGSR